MTVKHLLGPVGFLLCALVASATASANSTNSAAAIALPGVVEIETHDEDAEVRRTKIWIVSEGDTMYVRTTDSKWNANLLREPRAILHLEVGAVAASAVMVSDAELQASVNALFAEKYGFANTPRSGMVWFGSANMWALTLDSL